MGVGFHSVESETFCGGGVRDNCRPDLAVPMLGCPVDAIGTVVRQGDVTDDGYGPEIIAALAQKVLDIGKHLPGIDVAVLVGFTGCHHDDPKFAVIGERDAEWEEAAILLEVLLGSSEGRAQGFTEFAFLDRLAGNCFAGGLIRHAWT
jgi:hypothetical protein